MESPDHFITRDGVTYAGTHLIVDLWGGSHFADRNRLEDALIAAVKAAGATLLHIHLHTFGDGGGVSGVAVLAESHISVHTWPERGYAAFDIFMCGDARPDLAAEVLKKSLTPEKSQITNIKRGIILGT